MTRSASVPAHPPTAFVARAVLLLLALALPASEAIPATAITYPEGYRSWPHVKSMAITSAEHPLHGAFGGIHHVYVNPVGARALREGKDLPDRTVLVFDLLAAHEEGGALTEGARKLVGVMVRDSRHYAATGGWGFEGFAGDSRTTRLVTDMRGQCFECHTSQRESGFVFSRWRP
jgi:hypothetical protein